MANEEHLAILRQGVDAWNAWRQNVLNPAPDLSAANLEGANLEGAKLGRANLRGANLEGARLRYAILGGAYLDMKNPFRRTSETNLSRADLRNAYLGWASMYWANLEAADLAGADLRNAYLFGAKLYKTKLAGASLVAATLDLANVQEAQLNFAHLNGASLRWANLEGAILVETVFANVDLSATKGLETCDHRGPSILDHRTLQRSGRLPLAFLRGCGLSDWQIESTKLHDPGLTSEQITEILYRVHDLRATRPIQIHNLFISYSHADSVFLEHLEKHLVEQGIRFWRDIHDAPAGPLEEIVVRAIRHNPTYCLCSRTTP